MATQRSHLVAQLLELLAVLVGASWQCLECLNLVSEGMQ